LLQETRQKEKRRHSGAQPSEDAEEVNGAAEEQA
jgi:hypothetical protein